MAVTTVAPVPAPAAPTPVAWIAPRRGTIEEFERIPDEVLPEGERIELIDGQIYTKTPQNDPHIFASLYSIEALRAVFGAGYAFVTQKPTRFKGGSEVEPDILILRGAIREYEGRRVDPPTDVALLVEVSDTTLAYDQANKGWLYATQGVPEYWIVNLPNRTLEVRRRPRPEAGAYAETVVYAEGETVPAGSGEVAVADLLPKGV